MWMCDRNRTGETKGGRLCFRSIRQAEVDQAITIEQICFPPHEACSPKSMRERIAAARDLFLVAADEQTGLIAGFLNGLATDEPIFRDEFFTNADLHKPGGKYVMLLGLDILPEYRKKGLAKKLVKQYIEREKEREALILTCQEEKISMYRHLGFMDKGISNSTWGGETWHEMIMQLQNVRL